MSEKSPDPTYSTARRPLRRPLSALVVLALAGALAGACSSSSPSAAGTSSPSATPLNTATASAAVKTVWTNFFSKNTPISQKETLLENGTGTMAPAVQAFASNPMVGQVTASVQNVTFPSPTTANVTYSISLGGQVVENAMAGTAVYQNGQWLVSDSTLCGLLQLAASQGGSSAPIPGCGS